MGATDRLELNPTHDPQRSSWVASANTEGSDFPIQNLPFGIFSTAFSSPRIGIAIGDSILDLYAVVAARLLAGTSHNVACTVAGSSLNTLMSQGHGACAILRAALADLLDAEPSPASLLAREHADKILVKQSSASMHLPAVIGGFADFLTSVDHIRRARKATHPENPVPRTLHHMPIAYNGRASSIRVSGHQVSRPNGQSLSATGEPQFGPASALDFELEMGVFVGLGTQLGDIVSVSDAARHLFGFCLLNDWSARDIQRWESLPLGPFLGKSFSSVISPWVVTAEALVPFECARSTWPTNVPPPLSYLDDSVDALTASYSIESKAWLSSEAMRVAGEPPVLVASCRLSEMLWTFRQILAHQTSNGCDIRPGDLVGSGTLSGPADDSAGCLAEFPEPLQLPDGSSRRWLADGDEVTFRARATRDGFVPIGFGECRSMILPARPYSQ